jgi:spermidine synthase
MQYVEVARARSQRGEVVLRRRRDEAKSAPDVLELRVNGVFVMDTAETGTERHLASVALQQMTAPRRVLVAGLGLGFTLHEVLADHRVEEVVVVEIEDALVGWMRDGTIPHGPGYLADERVHVVVADIAMAMAEAAPQSYDVILLDVDNGPGSLVHAGNERVYSPEFLAVCGGALRPGGVLAIWSAAAARELQEEMEQVLGNVTALPYEVSLQDRQESFWLYLSRVDSSGQDRRDPR